MKFQKKSLKKFSRKMEKWPDLMDYSNDLTQMVNFPTQISDCDSHSLALLDLFHASDTSICYLVKKVLTNLDSSNASRPDWIPVVVLKNCNPGLSYIVAELFNICLKESCFFGMLEFLIGGPCI